MINQKKAKEAFEEYLQLAKKDERILGIMLSGGRGKGVATKNSDYDVMLITTDKGFVSVKKDYPKTEYIDSLPHSISEFREHAKSGSRTEYDKYTFSHVKALLDKTGDIQKLINEKGKLDPIYAKKLAGDSLGGYLNSLHRSLKNFRDGNKLAGLLDAQESISRLITFIFAIENRVRPFNKFLGWELENYPLLQIRLKPAKLLGKIEHVTKTGDLKIQKELHLLIKKLAVKNGFKKEISGWEGYYFG